jgi:hypothetical protein
MIFVSFNHTHEAIFCHVPKNAGSFVKNILETDFDFMYIEIQYIAHKIHPFCYTNDLDCNPEHMERKKIGQQFIKDYDCKTNVTEYSKVDGGILNYVCQSSKYNTLIKLHSQQISQPLQISTENMWKTYTKIVVIRNPYTRFISGLVYINYYLHKYRLSFTSERRAKLAADRFIYYDNPPKTNLSFLTEYEDMESDTITDDIYALHENRNQLTYMDYWHIYETQSQHIYLAADPYTPNSPTWHLLRFENIMDDLFILFTTKFGYPKTRNQWNEDIIDETKYPKNKRTNKKPFYEYYTPELFEFVNSYFTNDFENFGYMKFNTLDEFQQYYRV